MLSNLFQKRTKPQKKKSKFNRNRAPRITSNVSDSRAFYPYIPTEMNFRLKYSLNTPISTTAGNDNRNYFGLYEFLNRVPLYSDQMFQIYRRARVTGVKIMYEFINRSATQVADIICCVVPYSDRNSITVEAARQRPRSTWRTAGLASGMSRVVVSKRFNSQYYYGENVGPDSQRWMTPSSAGAGAPLDTNDPVILMIAAPSSVAEGMLAHVNIHVEYDVRYFDLSEPGISSRKPQMIEEDSEFEEEDSKPALKVYHVTPREYRQLTERIHPDNHMLPKK